MAETSLDKPQIPIARTACGGKLKDTTRYPWAIYRGEQVYFCTHACLRAFEESPDPFMVGDVEYPTISKKGANAITK